MIDAIIKIFSSLSSAAKTAKALQKIIADVSGDERALLEEIKENAGLCWLVTKREVDAFKIIPELQIQEYNRLLKTDFDFNSLSTKKIRASKRYQSTDLKPFIGKETHELVEAIYDRIKELKRIHKLDPDSSRTRWSVRFINLHKRIPLLLEHLSK